MSFNKRLLVVLTGNFSSGKPRSGWGEGITGLVFGTGLGKCGIADLSPGSNGQCFSITINSASCMLYRFGGQGLYLLDESEAALSPTRQLAVLSRMPQLVGGSSQFIIATHSPILLAYPGA